MERDMTFDAAPQAFASLIVAHLGREIAVSGRLVRDIYGRLSFVTDQRPPQQAEGALREAAIGRLGAYGQPASYLIVSMAEDPERFARLASEPAIMVLVDGSDADGAALRLLDRRLSGDEWLLRPEPLIETPPRLVFYSVKGGVGRSTALAVAAADLAARGSNVLVLDMDLEAPGIGGMLLPEDAMPDFGVVDWFAAVAAGADASALVPDMVGQSSFTDAGAVVDVVPAHGRDPRDYLGKLARVFAPGSAGKTFAGQGFAAKTRALIEALVARRQYDVVLIDARAGLHESSAGLLLGLGAAVFVFGVDTSQTFDDLGLLAAALHHAFARENQGADLRGDFRMVHAKAPRDAEDRDPFIQKSWDTWSRTLYDDLPAEAEPSADAFVFDVNDRDAPHYPLEIIGDPGYDRFDPRTKRDQISAQAYQPIFGGFLAGLHRRLGTTP